jgi:hypothetical protein
MKNEIMETVLSVKLSLPFSFMPIFFYFFPFLVRGLWNS